MLGPAKPRHLSEPIAVSLGGLVRRNNFYRHLEAKLDLDFVREWARELCAKRGRASIDPVVFFKLQLVRFFEGIRSERKLVETHVANTPARSVADPFTRSVSQSTASLSLYRGTGPCSHPTDERDRSARQLAATASILNCIN